MCRKPEEYGTKHQKPGTWPGFLVFQNAGLTYAMAFCRFSSILSRKPAVDSQG